DGKDWQPITDAAADKYTIAVSQLKTLLAQGETKKAKAALEQLKSDFPEIATADLDEYFEAELKFSIGKLVSAARKYSKFLTEHPDSKLYDAALQRHFQIATAFFAGEKRKFAGFIKLSAYDEGETIMRNIADRTGNTPMAKKAMIAIADCYTERKLYLEAYEVWTEISVKWPTGRIAQNALLYQAQSMHSAYQGYDYEKTPLISAKSYYINFKLRYPQLVEEYDIDGKLALIEQQLAYKQYKLAEYYAITGKEQASNLYYQVVLDKWPDSNAAVLVEVRMDSDPETASERLKPMGRKAFDVTNSFLDSWFGLAKLAEL
ncbi:MAG: tetratricopeptide repeat protein, partial [Anaerohalosphaera sp.]|nr:tetratricopeptide repeat protein [Anaerohalosphaera sp.]